MALKILLRRWFRGRAFRHLRLLTRSLLFGAGCHLPIQDRRLPIRKGLQRAGVNPVQDGLVDRLHIDIAGRADTGVAESPLFALADGHTDFVPLSQAKLACDWCDYLETHARRVYSALARPEQHAAIALSKRLVGWKREEGFFTVRDVYRSGWTALDSPDAARGALLVLEEYGWVRRGTDTQAPGRPSETYRINPRIGGNHAGK
jgi:hypothetical protein